MSQPVSLQHILLSFSALTLMACSDTSISEGNSADWDGADFVHQVSDLEMDEDISYGVLPNGLRYAVMENDTPTRTATLLMRIDAGSLDETDETRGIAHFLEHMAFNGSDAIPEGEMIKRLERLGLAFGPDTNASTGFDQTVYQLELPDTSDALLDEALSIFRETAERLTLAPDAIDRERGVILAEKRARNSPGFRAAIASLEFQTMGTGLVESLPIGTEETIQSVTPEQFRTFYESQYRPEDTFIVLVGDRPAEQLAQKIEATFADWSPVGEPATDATVPEYDFETARYGSFFDPSITTVATLFTVSPVKPESERRDTAENRAESLPLYFANAIVNRRLSRKVRDGEADYTSAGIGNSELYGAAEITSLSLSAETEKLDNAFFQAERELRRALDHGFSQAELDEQIANARKSWEVAVQTAPTRRTSSLARQILSSFADEQVMTSAASSLERFDCVIEEMTVEQVEAAFREAWSRLDTAPQFYLQSDTPIEEPETYLENLLETSRSVSLPAEDRGEVGEFAYSEWGTPGDIVSRDEIEDIGITTILFANNVKLNLKATPYETDVIRTRVLTGQGSAFFPQDKPAFGLQLRSILARSGLGEHTVDELSTLTAGRAVGVSRSFGFEEMSLSGATVPEDFELQMELMAAYLTDPAYRENVVTNYQDQIRSVWSKLDSTPSGAAGLVVPSLLSSNHWTDAHPSETEALDLDLTELSTWYVANLEGGPIEISVVGDFEEAEIVQTIARTFGSLPMRTADWQDYPQSALDQVFPDGRSRPVEITHSGEPETAQYRIYWPVEDHEDVLTDRELGVLTSVLRLELTEALREIEGATYSPNVTRALPDAMPEWGYLGVIVEVSPDEIERVGMIVEQVAEKLRSEGVSDDVFNRAMTPLLESIETSLENNSYWLNVIDEAQTEPETLDRHRSRESMYRNMTVGAVSEQAANLLMPERAIRVNVLPER